MADEKGGFKILESARIKARMDLFFIKKEGKERSHNKEEEGLKPVKRLKRIGGAVVYRTTRA